MSATKIEVGKVYKRGDSEVYIIYIREKYILKGEVGINRAVPEEVHAVNLSKPYNFAKIKTKQATIGAEVQKPFNKENWGIKTLYSILYNECRFMYEQTRRTGLCKASTRENIAMLYGDVADRCLNKTRNISNYKKLLYKKNNLCRLVLKNKSNSRGAAQRISRFDIISPVKLPCCKECPKDVTEGIDRLNAFYRLIWDNGARNHMNLTFREFADMGLNKTIKEVRADSPFQILGVVCRGTENARYKNWVGILDICSYDIKMYKGQEYLPNAKISDGKNYIKPYGWPEIYKGRIQTEEETKALRGCKNKKGLTYPQWLSLTPKQIKALCGHLAPNLGIENMLNCSKCAKIRYSLWLK